MKNASLHSLAALILLSGPALAAPLISGKTVRFNAPAVKIRLVDFQAQTIDSIHRVGDITPGIKTESVLNLKSAVVQDIATNQSATLDVVSAFEANKQHKEDERVAIALLQDVADKNIEFRDAVDGSKAFKPGTDVVAGNENENLSRLGRFTGRASQDKTSPGWRGTGTAMGLTALFSLYAQTASAFEGGMGGDLVLAPWQIVAYSLLSLGIPAIPLWLYVIDPARARASARKLMTIPGVEAVDVDTSSGSPFLNVRFTSETYRKLAAIGTEYRGYPVFEYVGKNFVPRG